MAGILPGAQAARRRRIHHLLPSSPLPLGRVGSNRAYQEEKLGLPAREAKQRLDGRLRALMNSQSERVESGVSEERLRSIEVGRRELQTEVFGRKKRKTRMLRWAIKLGVWKERKKEEDEEECAVCLEEFKVGENLFNLSCSHKFHSSCLLPWLQANNHCPCCRFAIFS